VHLVFTRRQFLENQIDTSDLPCRSSPPPTHAFLTVITAAERATIPTPEGMIPRSPSTSSAD
jgi:hypothetical protein